MSLHGLTRIKEGLVAGLTTRSKRIQDLERKLEASNTLLEEAARWIEQHERKSAQKELKMNTWQPIETAPLGREDVLLWTPSGQLVGFTYDRRKWYASGVKASHEDCDVELYEPPTHWVPIPVDPVGSASTLA